MIDYHCHTGTLLSDIKSEDSNEKYTAWAIALELSRGLDYHEG